MKRLKKIQNNIVLENLSDHRKFFLKNGYLHLKNFLPKKELINIKKKCINFKKKTKIKKDLIFDLHRNIISVYNTINNNSIKLVAKELFKTKKLSGIQTAFFSTPKKGYGFPPHQDDFFFKMGFNNTMNIWIPLIKIGARNGTLYFYMNSHKNGVNKKLNFLALNSSNAKSFKELKKYKTKKMICNIGDVVFINNHIFHKGGHNSSSSKRYILSFTYLKDKKKFYAGKTANRKKIKLD